MTPEAICNEVFATCGNPERLYLSKDLFLRFLQNAARGAQEITGEIRAPKAKAARKSPAKPKAGEKMTPAKAARYRRNAMEHCGCLRCSWALNPPLTHVEHSERIDIATKHNTAKSWPSCQGLSTSTL